MYQLIRDGYDLKILGRLDVSHQYETSIYNYFFDSVEEQFNQCINRLLDKDDLLLLEKNKASGKI